jgi:primosomal protein N' (replication factor Y) (superfamily II helicase)
VALDVPLAKLFDYLLPDGAHIARGDRVAVRFGNRAQIGVVVQSDTTTQIALERLKPISAVRDDAPRLPDDWLELMGFLSSYYQRPLGETIMAALPPRLRSVKPLPRKALEEAPPSSPRFVAPHALTPEQAAAAQRIVESLGHFAAILLHGVTGSGKTEVYLHAISQVVQQGGQALVLVPEISLTPQLEARFRAAFPEAPIALMHSALEDIARTKAWLSAA